MLTIDIQRLGESPVTVEADIAGDDPLWNGSQINFLAPLRVRALAELTGGRAIWVHGSLRGRIGAECRRCLRPLDLAIEEDFEFFFDPQASETDEDLTVFTLDPAAEELALAGPVRERIVLVAPRFPICRPQCRGLCPSCGQDLNEGECDCTPVEGDPRWAPLMALRGDS